jgi:UDP-N-acetylmuramyl pentapeptide synthase
MSRTPAGRKLLRDGVVYRLWPVLSRLARVYRRTSVRDTRVIAVVGSSGKSTTTRAVAVALGVAPPQTTLANAWSGVALAVLRIPSGQRHAVIEVGIAGRGEMEGYARMLLPDVTVVTSIGREHVTNLGSLDVTRAEKAKMVAVLDESGSAVLNGDDANVMWMGTQTRARLVTFGFGPDCDVRAEDVRLDWPRGTRFRLHAFGQKREVSVRLIGRHTILAALAAIAVSQREGLPLEETLTRLGTLEPTPGRMDPVPLPNGAWMLRDDFKSSLETMHAALDVLAEIPARRRIVVFGEVWEAPEPERSTYEALGARAAQMAAKLIVVGEHLPDYRAGAVRAGMRCEAVIEGGRTPQQVTAALAGIVEPGDVVLIKGHRNQRLDRVRMLLQGRPVLCNIHFCDIRTIDCTECPMLESGWAEHRVIM